jgi:hypothetical protein
MGLQNKAHATSYSAQLWLNFAGTTKNGRNYLAAKMLILIAVLGYFA